MLSVNKPLMDAKFETLTTPQTGKVYMAAYNAYKNMATKMADAAGDVEDTDLAPGVAQSKTEVKQQIENDAKQFASDFCEGISEMLSEISTQIDAHVKALANGMTITMLPQGIATVVSPMGPCTGSMVIKNGATANIIIS